MKKIIRSSTTLSFAFLLASILVSKPVMSQGSLDAGFGSGGVVTNFFGQGETNNTHYKMLLQEDGKILIASAGQNSSGYALLARFNNDGSLDQSFGTGGKVETQVYNQNQGIFLYDMVMGSNGEIFITGRGIFGSNHMGCERFIIKYLPNGSLDASFDTDGKLLFVTQQDQTNNCITNTGIGLLADGRIVLASYFNVPDRTELEIRNAAGGLLDRLNNVQMIVEGLKVLPSDDILLYGSYLGDFKIEKYSPALSPIGSAFFADFGSTDIPSGIAVSPQNGNIVVTGNSVNRGAIAAFTNAGIPDNSFSGDGKLLLVNGTFNSTGDVAIQPDGKIVVAGTVHANGKDGWAFARLLSTGEPDLCFGQDGWFVVRNDIENQTGHSVAIQPDKKILIAGKKTDGFAPASFLLARYIPPTNSVWYTDADSDGYGDKTDAGVEHCSALAGTVSNNLDCNDNNAAVNPAANETCNGFDDNCNNVIDEGCPAANPSVTINSITINEGAGIANLTVTVSPVSPVQVKLNYKTIDGTAQSKMKNKDFKSVGNGSITIPPGTPSAQISITIISDNNSEPDEEFYVQLTKATGAQLGNPATGTVIITETSSGRASQLITTNTADEKAELVVKAFPNPSTNHFTLQINTNGDQEALQLKVYDTKGNLIESRTNIRPDTSIQIGDQYKAGLFLVQWIQGTRRGELKLIKQ